MAGICRLKYTIMYKLMQYVTAAAALLVLASCSVKEDRHECPCLLTIILERVPERIMNRADGLWINISTEGKGTALDSPVTGSDYSGPEWLGADVDKGLVSVICSNSKALAVPYGSECDSIYAHYKTVRCFEDNARDTVLLRKQWCTATIILKNAYPEEKYLFEIHGNWAGISQSGLEPVPGRFYSVPRRIDTDKFQIRLPRQGDDSMVMSLNSVYEYSLGKLIAGSGYDWKAQNLDDIRILIDYASAEIAVSVSPWDGGPDFGDIEI